MCERSCSVERFGSPRRSSLCLREQEGRFQPAPSLVSVAPDVRTIFLLRYISDIPLREQITKTTNIAERYNQFCEWIRFAAAGLMAENDPEEQQRRVRYTDIVANALMLQNVADMQMP